MYIPKPYRESDTQELHRFMRANHFATLITTIEGAPFATHIPLVLDPHVGPFGTLHGHVARANPHWQHLQASPTLVAFVGAHAYISPAWYATQPGVPTWNFSAVHAYGIAQLVQDPAAVRAMLQRMIAIEEASHEPAWSMDALDAGYVEHMLAQIVAFELPIERLEGKYKLSQNRTAADRAGVAEHLNASSDPLARDVARQMQHAR